MGNKGDDKDYLKICTLLKNGVVRMETGITDIPLNIIPKIIKTAVEYEQIVEI